MNDTEIKKEIRNFLNLSTQDDHEATDKSLEVIIKAKIDNRYNDAYADVVSETE
jgi:hypothetical protein